MARIAAVGEVLIDFAEKGRDSAGYPLLQAQPGGAPANFLAAAVKYGHEGTMLAKVGDDAFGRLLKGTLDSRGIDTSGVIIDPDHFTTLAFVTLDENGDRSFSFARKPGADTQLRYDEIDPEVLDRCDVFHFGSLSMTDPVSRRTLYSVLRYARDAGKLISYDPNYRAPLWNSVEEAVEMMRSGFTYADVVKISGEELDLIYPLEGSPSERAAEGAKRLMEGYGISLVYVTMGRDGCFFRSAGREGFVKAPKGVPVRDTTGAGDIFGGAAMAELLDRGITESGQISLLCKEDLEDIVRFAVTAATLSTTAPGGINSVPDRQAVEEHMG